MDDGPGLKLNHFSQSSLGTDGWSTVSLELDVPGLLFATFCLQNDSFWPSQLTFIMDVL